MCSGFTRVGHACKRVCARVRCRKNNVVNYDILCKLCNSTLDYFVTFSLLFIFHFVKLSQAQTALGVNLVFRKYISV